MIKAQYLTDFQGKPVCDCLIQGEPDKLILEFKTIIKGICKNSVLLGPMIKTLDDMIANIDDDIEQIKKEMKEND